MLIRPNWVFYFQAKLKLTCQNFMRASFTSTPLPTPLNVWINYEYFLPHLTPPQTTVLDESLPLSLTLSRVEPPPYLPPTVLLPPYLTVVFPIAEYSTDGLCNIALLLTFSLQKKKSFLRLGMRVHVLAVFVRVRLICPRFVLMRSDFVCIAERGCVCVHF